MFEIRPENEKDYLEVENLVRNSFWNIYRPGAYEHFIVHNLREDESFISKLAYVIEKDDKIIGHINYSTGKIDYDDSSKPAVILETTPLNFPVDLNAVCFPPLLEYHQQKQSV